MPDLLIRDLSQETLVHLKARAAKNGRSLQAELQELLEQTAVSERKDWVQPAAEIRARTAGRPHSDSAELIAEDRSQ
jgi:plasmid stability protein